MPKTGLRAASSHRRRAPPPSPPFCDDREHAAPSTMPLTRSMEQRHPSSASSSMAVTCNFAGAPSLTPRSHAVHAGSRSCRPRRPPAARRGLQPPRPAPPLQQPVILLHYREAAYLLRCCWGAGRPHQPRRPSSSPLEPRPTVAS